MISKRSVKGLDYMSQNGITNTSNSIALPVLVPGPVLTRKKTEYAQLMDSVYTGITAQQNCYELKILPIKIMYRTNLYEISNKEYFKTI